MTSYVWRLIAALLSLTALPLTAWAQAFPDKPIRMVVPWPPGGSADAIGRVVGSALSVSLGQPVIVENIAGATGNIGTLKVVKSQPDGYTLLLASSTTNAANPSLYTKLPFHPIDDFVPISLIAVSPSVLIVGANSPYKSVQDIIDAAKAKPGKLNYGSGGSGNSGNLSGELFKSITKIDVTHVPYKGNSPAMVDLMGGQIDFMFDNGAISQIKSGKVRGLAVTAAQRLSALPEIPTFKELGWPGMEFSTWFGLAAPKGTPVAVVEKISGAMTVVMQKPDVVKRLQDMGAEVKTTTPAAYATFWKEEIERYRGLVKLSGAKLE